METAETGKTSSISKRYIQFDNILSTKRSQAEAAHLPDPSNNHGSSLLALLQHLMLKKHVIPSVLHPELIVPEEIPDNIRRCVLKDSAAAILRRAILE
jgi:hypothetical protein